MKLGRFKGIDYDFRPQSYGVTTDPLQAILAKVQGTKRRQMIRDYWAEGRLEELADTHLKDVLTEEQRASLGAIHPSFMGGEYLPSYGEGEVEIARIELQSTTADVISVRARHEAGMIRYFVVDEYETEFRVEPESSPEPLTLAELIALIDGAADEDSLATCFTIMNYEGDKSLDGLERIKDFTTVESDFYPQLALHYQKVTHRWYLAEKKLLTDTRRLRRIASRRAGSLNVRHLIRSDDSRDLRAPPVESANGARAFVMHCLSPQPGTWNDRWRMVVACSVRH